VPPGKPTEGWDVEVENGVITINFYGVKAGWKHPVLLTSDVHFDNAHCNRDLYRSHLDWALERNAPVLDNGDFFCAMQGKWDKRKSEDAMRPEYRGGRYLDKLVDEASAFLMPYADIMAVMGYGNHETAMLKHHETDLTDRLIYKMRSEGGSSVVKGRFAFWVIYKFWFGNGYTHATLRQFNHHGWGGGGPVTRGTIDTARMAIYVPDADIVHTGHVHHAYEMPIERWRISNQGKEFRDTQIHIRTPGYKDEITGGNGWGVERGMAPRPQGGHALEFYVTDAAAKQIGIRSWRMT